MSEFKYKVGDRVRITDTSIKGTIESIIRGQLIVNYEGSRIPAWPEEVFLMESVEEEVDLIPKFGEYSDNEPLDIPTMTTEFVKEHGLPCPNGYIFKDENGNEILTSKIILEKKKEVIPNLQLDSIRTVREYCTEYSRIWLEIYEDNPEVCIFTHLWVDEDHRRKGYGTKALEQAEIIAKDLGCNTIQLKVETYSWMSKWYLRSGYSFLMSAEDNYTWLTKSI